MLQQLLAQQLRMLWPGLLPAGLRRTCQALLPGYSSMMVLQLRHRMLPLRGLPNLEVRLMSPALQPGAAGHWVAAGEHRMHSIC